MKALLILFAASLLYAVGPVTSNGFDHYVYWKSSDSSLYHVSVQGSVKDTHLVKKYVAKYLTTDIILDTIGPAGYIKDTGWISEYNYQKRYRHDSLFYISTYNYYNPPIITYDTMVAVHVGTRGKNPNTIQYDSIYLGLSTHPQVGDYLIVNGRRVLIRQVSGEGENNHFRLFWVDKTCPKGVNVHVNATFRTLPSLKTLSRDAGYSLLKDPNQANKLYVFYISDSGRVMGEVTWDNGLTWEEMPETQKNPMLTDTSNHARTNLIAAINTPGQISLSWSNPAGSATLTVPVTADTVTMYVRPNTGNDGLFTTLSNVSSFKTQHTINTPFLSIDRCIHQILMLENNTTRAEVLSEYPTSTSDIGYRRAEATRSYVIKMLPGNYNSGSQDAGVDGYWNKVLFSGWDKSLTIESYYTQPDSFAAIIINNWSSGGSFVKQGSGEWGDKMVWFHSLTHMSLNHLKFSSDLQRNEDQRYAYLFNVSFSPTYNNLKFVGNIFYCVDSTAIKQYGRRSIETIFSGMGGFTPRYFENIVFINNIFHRLYDFSETQMNTTYWDFSGGMQFFNNTLYKWRATNNNHYIWGGFSLRTRYSNNIQIEAPSPDSAEDGSSGLQTLSSRNNIITNSAGFSFLDTIPTSHLFHRISLASSAASGGDNINILDSISRTDAYSILREGRDIRGASMPAPDNPLRLRLAEDNSQNPRALQVYIDSVSKLASSVDMIRIYRSVSGYTTNAWKPWDTTFNKSTIPASYLSLNAMEGKYWFTVAVGDTFIVNGQRVVNWSVINPSINGVQITLRGLVPPQNCFTIDTSKVGADTVTLRGFSPQYKNPALTREKDLERIYLALFPASDSVKFFTAYGDTSWDSTQTDFSYPAYNVNIAGDTVYIDSSATYQFVNLNPGTRYLAVAIPKDSTGNFCRIDSVRKHIFSFRTKATPPSVLKVKADTISGVANRLAVTIWGLKSLSSSPAIDSTNLKLFVRDTGYVTIPGTSINTWPYRDMKLSIKGVSRDTFQTTVDNLTQTTLYYLSVTIGSTDGYCAPITIGTNTFIIRTPRSKDDSAPIVTPLSLDVILPTDPAKQNGLWAQYTINGLGSLTNVPDRDSLYYSIAWSTSSDSVKFYSLQLKQTIITPAMIKSKGSSSYTEFARSGIFPGKKYFFTLFVRDTAYNWTTAAAYPKLTDSLVMPANTTRPLNVQWDTNFVRGFDVLHVAIPSTLKNQFKPGDTTASSLTKIGVWVLDATAGIDSSTNFNAIVDAGGVGLDIRHKFLLADDSAEVAKGFDTTILKHNSTYYVVCSPMNVFGNWALVQKGQSWVRIKTPLDSTQIFQPVFNDSFSVSRMRDPDSVRVFWSLSSYQYTGLSSGQKIPYDSILIFYKTDGTYPKLINGTAIDGYPLSAFKITTDQATYSNVTKNICLYGRITCGSTNMLFTAFLANTRAVGSSNRISRDTLKSRSGPVTPPCAYPNQLQVTADAKGGAISVKCKWTGSVADNPAHIRLLYRIASDSLFPPYSYGDARFYARNYFNVQWDAQQETSFDLTENINYYNLYYIAGFNAKSDTVWSKDLISRSTGRQWDTAQMPPPDDIEPAQNDLTLDAVRINSRTIDLNWSDPKNTIPAIRTSENGKAQLYYKYKTSSTDQYSRWIIAMDSASLNKLTLTQNSGTIRLSERNDPNNIIASNQTYYIVIAPGDSNGTAADTNTFARDSVYMYVPNPVADSIKVSVLGDTALLVNYGKLNNLDSVKQDPYIILGSGLVIVTDTGYIDNSLFGRFSIDSLKKTNHSSRSPSGHTFLIKEVNFSGGEQDQIVIGAMEGLSLDSINLNKKHYISFAFLTNNRDPSSPVSVNTVQYFLTKPWFKPGYPLVAQVDDSIIRVEFAATDSEDPVLGINVRYAINDTLCVDPMQFEGNYSQFVTGTYRLTADKHIKPDSVYTSFIKIPSDFSKNGSNGRYFFNNDTTSLTLRFDLSDLMGPISDSIDLTARKSIVVDAKAPVPVITINDSFAPSLIKVNVKCSALELDTILASDTGYNLSAVVIPYHGDTTLEFTSKKKLYLTFMDKKRNIYDTLWAYFKVAIPQIVKPQTDEYVFDNGNIKLAISSLTLSDTLNNHLNRGIDTLFYVTGKDTVPGVVKSNIGFVSTSQSSYYFEWFHKNLDSAVVWKDGVNISLKYDSAMYAKYGSNMFIYSYNKRTGDIYYVGGQIDASGYINANYLKFNIIRNPATDNPDDTTFFFVGVDSLKAAIGNISVSYDSTANSLKLSLKASDNTRSLKTIVKVFGYDSTHSPVYLYSDTLYGSPLDTSRSIVFNGDKEQLLRGVFAAVRTSDQDISNANRSVYAYTRCPFTRDSLRVTVSGTNNYYQLVSFPYALASDETDVLYVLKGLSQGKYDRSKFRLYRVADNGDTVTEFKAGTLTGKDGVDRDSTFTFTPGSTYFLLTRYLDDNNVNVLLRNVSSPALNSQSRGYILKEAPADGWYLTSVPFSGNISIRMMDQVSTLRSGSKSLIDRLLIRNRDGWVFVPSGTLASSDIGQGFIVYLHAGEKLVVPVISDKNMLYSSGNLLLRNTVEDNAWKINITLADKAGNTIDGYNEVGVSTGADSIWKEMPSINTSGLSLSIMSKSRMLCRETRTPGKKGEVFTLVLDNCSDKSGDCLLRFSGLLKNLPEGWQVWLDSKDRGYAADLTAMDGVYPVLARANASQTFTLIAGEAAFVESRITNKEPKKYALDQNFPNPFNPSTTVRFAIKDFRKSAGFLGTHVGVDVYSINGKLVNRLLDDVAVPGYHSVVWNGKAENGHSVASGIYMVQIRVRDADGKEMFNKTRKMILAK